MTHKYKGVILTGKALLRSEAKKDDNFFDKTYIELAKRMIIIINETLDYPDLSLFQKYRLRKLAHEVSTQILKFDYTFEELSLNKIAELFITHVISKFERWIDKPLF